MEDLQTILSIASILGISWLIWLYYKTNQKKTGGIVLDSCALIDGRILDIADSGFLHNVDLVMPSFILRELQLLADGSDNLKRSRARFGLEVAEKLQKSTSNFVVDSSIKSTEKIDEQLILLCKKRRSMLCTTDYNLNKVASVEGVVVLNVNELAKGLRPNYVPGDLLDVKILQKGESAGQGVGYLEDGTMVVVAGAAKLIGTKQMVVIERSLQTVAGKMCFANIRSLRSKR